MKRTDILIAVCLLGLSGLIIAKYGVWHPKSPDTVVVESSTKDEQDADHAAQMALLKKYSKPGVNFVAPSDPPAEPDPAPQAVQPYEPSPAPAAPAPAKPAAPAAPYPQAPAGDNGATANDDLGQNNPQAQAPVPYDDYTRALAGAQLGDPWNLSDQQLIDGMMSVFNPNQQTVFSNMWATMTPEEQAQWLYELRGTLAP